VNSFINFPVYNSRVTAKAIAPLKEQDIWVEKQHGRFAISFYLSTISALEGHGNTYNTNRYASMHAAHKNKP
jgi:hypothetical protein